MADIDIDPLGEHDKTDSHPDETGKTFPFTLGEVIEGESTWEPNQEQKTSFGGKSQRIRLTEEDVERLCKKLSDKYQLPKERYYDMFEIKMENYIIKVRKKPLCMRKES